MIDQPDDAATVIAACIDGTESDPLATTIPTVDDRVVGIRFIGAAVSSSHQGGVWVKV